MSRAGAPRAPRTPPGDKRGPPNWGNSPCWGPPGQGTWRRCRAGCVCACFVVVLWAAPRARGCGAVPPGGRRGGGHHPAAEQGASGLAQPGPAAHPPHIPPPSPPRQPRGRAVSRGVVLAVVVLALSRWLRCRAGRGLCPPPCAASPSRSRTSRVPRGEPPHPPRFLLGRGEGGCWGLFRSPPPVLFLEMISYLCGGAAGFGPGLPLRAPLSVTLSSAMKTIVPLSQLPASSFPSPWHLGVLRGQLCRALQPLGTPHPSPVGVGLLGSIPSCPWGVPVPLCHHQQQPRVPAHLNQPFMGALGLCGAAVPWL